MNWDAIVGFDGWSTTLADLIVKASKAFEAKDQVGKAEARDLLNGFIKYSPNDVAGPLDELALKAVFDIISKDWLEGAAELQTRSAELAKLTKQINAITADNVAAAESIRMTKIRDVIDRSADTIQALKDLKNEIMAAGANAEDVKTVAAKIDSAVKAIQNARTAVENL